MAQSEPVAWDSRPLPQVVAWAVDKGLKRGVRRVGNLKGSRPVLLHLRNPTESHCVLGTAAARWSQTLALSRPLQHSRPKPPSQGGPQLDSLCPVHTPQIQSVIPAR